MSEEAISQIISEIKKGLSLESPEHAWILVTGVLQRGGSNVKAGNTINFTFGGKTLSSKDLNNFIKKIEKTATNRQFARSAKETLAQVALELNIPGDLHRQMLLDHPNMSDAEKVWCSNFQTTNATCPDSVREWLVHNFKDRFSKNR